ncbi:hypothetical protein [Microbispora sp. NPDC049125]|uniref:hypothetical protein n=1 Tax=Microbispora sp. NPDC049125 TaxID=3154929 RepID=UPI0034674E7C
MNGLIRGAVLVAAATLPGAERRERYREQWLADCAGAGELGMSAPSVAAGAVWAAVRMNLSHGAAGPLGLAVVLVVGGIRLATVRPDWIPGVATALAGAALPILLLIVRRFLENGAFGDLANVARQARRVPGGPRRGRMLSLTLGGALLLTLSAVLFLYTRHM